MLLSIFCDSVLCCFRSFVISAFCASVFCYIWSFVASVFCDSAFCYSVFCNIGLLYPPEIWRFLYKFVYENIENEFFFNMDAVIFWHIDLKPKENNKIILCLYIKKFLIDRTSTFWDICREIILWKKCWNVVRPRRPAFTHVYAT